MSNVEETLEKKKKLGIIPKILFFLLFFIVLFYCYMHFIEPHLLVVQEYPIINEKIPDSFNGFKIVQFSDIHFGRTTNEKELENVVTKINDLKPDILLFTGDLFDPYITLSENNIHFLNEVLAKTTAKIGKYAVIGDNDSINIEAYEQILTSSGFKILKNENVPIYYEGVTPIYLAGISSISKSGYDLTEVLKNESTDAYQIFLCHEPIIFDEVKNETDLVLAGHSLGGLIRIPYVGGLYQLNNVGGYESGIYEASTSTLIVSNGIGTQDFSLRFLNVPSIQLYRLYNYE